MILLFSVGFFLCFAGHFETMDEDMTKAINELKLGVKPTRVNKSKGDNSDKHSALASYYRTLSKQQIEELQFIYKYDFELLGYKRDPPL